jgi:hypothetical protein
MRAIGGPVKSLLRDRISHAWVGSLNQSAEVALLSSPPWLPSSSRYQMSILTWQETSNQRFDAAQLNAVRIACHHRQVAVHRAVLTDSAMEMSCNYCAVQNDYFKKFPKICATG